MVAIPILTVSILLVALDASANLATLATESPAQVIQLQWVMLLICINVVFPDVDECVEESDECVTNADCKDTDGSYTCECSPGFIGDGLVGCRRKRAQHHKVLFLGFIQEVTSVYSQLFKWLYLFL